MEEQPTKRFRIGYALAQKKQESFIQPSLVNLASERGIDLVRIDTEKPLAIKVRSIASCTRCPARIGRTS